MKFTYLLAAFALLQVSEASDISCIRSDNGVECSEQTSLLNVLNDETVLAYYSYSEQLEKIQALNLWFSLIDTNRNE